MKTIDKEHILADHVLGSSQAVTPEGYLLCKDVPIARIGKQQYLNEELVDNETKLEGGADGIINVERREEDVFHPDTIASFQGKAVTDDHPDEMLGPHNFKEHVVGTTLNVRRGEGSSHDLLLADLLITDADAIAAVRAGKREVSCGYDAKYEGIGPGQARQHNIIGNHVALVQRGRCGGTCSIGDEDTMSTKTKDKKSIFDRMRQAFSTKDAKAFDEAMEEMTGENDADPIFDPNKGPGMHVHLHGVGGMDAQESANEEGAKEDKESTDEEPPKWFKDFCAATDARMKDMKKSIDAMGKKSKDAVKEEGEEEAEGGVAVGDADEDEDEDDKKTSDADKDDEDDKDTTDADEEEDDKEKAKDKKSSKDKKGTRDSAPLKDDFQSVIADAEILAPGLKLPTFDAAQARKATVDAMCVHRRRALRAFAGTKDGAAAIIELNGGKTTLDMKAMTCDAMTVMFNAAVAGAKRSRRSARGTLDLGAVIKQAAPLPRTPADFNKAKNDFYKNN